MNWIIITDNLKENTLENTIVLFWRLPVKANSPMSSEKNFINRINVHKLTTKISTIISKSHK